MTAAWFAGYQTKSCIPSCIPVQPSFLSSSPPLICISHLILKGDLSFLLSFFSHHGVVKCLKIEVRDFCLDLLHPCRKECAAAAPHTSLLSISIHLHTRRALIHTEHFIKLLHLCCPLLLPNYGTECLNLLPLS